MRAPGQCESTDRARRNANPGLFFDLADSAAMYCYHCDQEVCTSCQTNPIDRSPGVCDYCGAWG